MQYYLNLIIGKHQNVITELPDQIPFDERSYLSTSCGLLFNELIASPSGLCKSMIKMLDLALDMDTGRYTKATADIILYIVRLALRFEAFLIFLIQHNIINDDRLNGTGYKSFVRGLDIPHKKVINLLHRVQINLRKTINKRVFPMLENWASYAISKQKLLIACKIHAHIVYCYKNLLAEDLNEENVSIFLSSQIFLTTRYRYTVDSNFHKIKREKNKNIDRSRLRSQTAKEIQSIEALLNRPEDAPGRLGIPQVEMFDIFQQQRGNMIHWLENNVKHANYVFEAIVRVVTFTGSRSKTINDPTPFEWRSLLGKHNRGRYVPLTEAALEELEKKLLEIEKERLEDEELLLNNQDPNAQKRRWKKYRHVIKHKNHDRIEHYDEYMREQQNKEQVNTEINLQVGDFTLKTERLDILDEDITDMDDFCTVFNKGIEYDDNNPAPAIQCAEVRKTTNRTWLRLVGKRHDVQLWNIDLRPIEMDGYSRKYGSSLGRSEMWIVHTLEPTRKAHLKDIKLFLPKSRHSDKASVARLIGYMEQKPKKKIKNLKKKLNKIMIILIKKKMMKNIEDVNHLNYIQVHIEMNI